MDKQLRKSRRFRVFAGVCGGFAEYFNIDPTIVRIIWAALSLTGAGFVAYIIAAIIMPDANDDFYSSNSGKSGFSSETGSNSNSSSDEWREPTNTKANTDRSRNVIGAVLIITGILVIFRQVFNWIDFKYLFPFILIAIGCLILYRSKKSN